MTEISSQKQLADLLEVGPAAVTLAKTRGVPRSWTLKIAALFGINPLWIKTGSGPIFQAGRENTFFVPRLSVKACAGAGSLDVMDNIAEEIPFNLDWINRKGNPGRMVIMEVVGDSMSPEIEAGDCILVDQSKTRLKDHALYVVGLDDGLQVKRIQKAPGLINLLSTNRQYPPILLQGDEIDTLRLIGQVLWISRDCS